MSMDGTQDSTGTYPMRPLKRYRYCMGSAREQDFGPRSRRICSSRSYQSLMGTRVPYSTTGPPIGCGNDASSIRRGALRHRQGVQRRTACVHACAVGMNAIIRARARACSRVSVRRYVECWSCARERACDRACVRACVRVFVHTRVLTCAASRICDGACAHLRVRCTGVV